MGARPTSERRPRPAAPRRARPAAGRSPAPIEPEALREGAARAVAALKLMSHESRLLLLCQLAHGESCVGDLEDALGIHQPTLSQQLGVLRNEGAVHTRREGKNIFYSVADPAMLEILNLLYRLYCPKG